MIEHEIARAEFLESQKALRARLKENLELIYRTKLEIQAEDRALEIRVHKLETEMADLPRGTDKWWLLFSRMNLMQKRRVEIVRDLEALKKMALDLAPVMAQAKRDVSAFSEAPV